MTTTTAEQRGEIYARLLHDLSAIYPIVDGGPNILGPIYGAGTCRRAGNIRSGLDRLLFVLGDATPRAIWRAAEATSATQQPLDRAALRPVPEKRPSPKARYATPRAAHGRRPYPRLSTYASATA
jgi:hypothetical protein